MDSPSKVQRNSRMKKKEPEIGEYMYMEILLHLPPHLVLKFKRVSKSWYSLITDPFFLRIHAAAAAAAAAAKSSQFFHPLMEPPGFLLTPTSNFPPDEKFSAYTILSEDPDQYQDQEPDSFSLKEFLDLSLPLFEDKFSDFFLVNSCNGLLLYNTKLGTPNDQYTVCNPITKQYKQVPLMDLLKMTCIKSNEEEEELGKNKTMVFDHPHIVFDPSILPFYKVLAVMRRPSSTHFQLYVYSDAADNIGSWKLLTNIPNEYITSWNTFMFNGVFYWLCRRHSICFDFVKEKVWLLSLPKGPAECPNPDVLYFGEFGGRIRLIQDYRNGNVSPTFACRFDIVEMELELGSRKWTRKTWVNFVEDQETSVEVMHLYKTEKGEEVVLLNVGYGSLVYYNITTKTVGQELTIPCMDHLDCLNAFPFTPTLYPLRR